MIAIPNYDQYYKDAYAKLQKYYEFLLAQEGGDVERAKKRLEEDYVKGNRVTLEDYAMGMENAQKEYQAGIAQENITNPQEARALQENQLQRGISLGGLAQKQASELKTKQDLRREAIDRALQKSQKEMAYSKERNMEDIGYTKTRGIEDQLANWERFKGEKEQERQDKSVQLAEQAYQREFQKNQAIESSQIAEKQLKMQQEALDAAKG